MSIAYNLVRNSALLFTANLVTRVSSAVLLLLVARFQRPEAAGVFALAFSYALLLEAVSQWGLDQLLIRDVARRPDRVQTIFSHLFSIRLLLLAAVIIGFALIMSLGGYYSDDTRSVLIVMAFVALPDVTVDMCQALFVAIDWLAWPTLVSVGSAVLRLGLGMIVLASDGTLRDLTLALLSASLAQMGLSLVLVHRQGIRLRLSIVGLHWRATLSQALPFGAIQMLVAVESYVGGILLSAAVSETMLGYYGVANSLLAALILIPNAIQLAVFPKMATAYEDSRQHLIAFYLRIYRYLVVLGGAAMLAVLISAETLTVRLYGSAFLPSAFILQILSGTLLIYFLNVPNVRAAIVLRRQDSIAGLLAVSVTFNVILTLATIPSLGVLSAPLARVASMSLFFVMNQVYTNRRLSLPPPRDIFWRPIVGATTAVLLVVSVNGTAVWLQLCLALTVYLAMIVLLGGLLPEEWRYVRSVLFSRSFGG